MIHIYTLHDKPFVKLIMRPVWICPFVLTKINHLLRLIAL